MLLCPATLREQALLELRYDGPIPPSALDDLRRIPHKPTAVKSLPDHALTQWWALARSNLKTEQRKLADARRLKYPAPTKWRLKQCLAARFELRPLAHEAAQRGLKLQRECRSPALRHHHHSAA